MASVALGAAACERRLDVQVLPECVRLEHTKPSPRSSSIFDGHVVRLRGARGETLGLEVRISDEKLRSVRVRLPDSAARVQAFSVRSLTVQEASTGMYGPSAGRGTYPDILVPALDEVETSDLAYFDVRIADAAAPGHYEGTLAFGGRDVPVVLEVVHARIALEKNPLVWVFYSPRDVALASKLPDGDSPALVEKERQYASLFREHGAYLASDVPPSRFPARKDLVSDVSYWPVAVDTTSDAAIERDVRFWTKAFDGSTVTPFAIPVDEPHTAEQRARARHIAEVIGQAGGGRPKFLRAVTDEATDAYGSSMDVFISPKNFPGEQRARAGRGERFWTYNGRPPEAGSMILDTDGAALRTWGWIAERYGVELWYAWEGLYFSDKYNGGGATDVLSEPITFDERRHGGTDFGNGDGVLAYPGPLPSLRLKALRRGLQDRLLLRELASCGGEALAADIVKHVVPTALGEGADEASWSSDETVWAQARNQVLDAIEARCP